MTVEPEEPFRPEAFVTHGLLLHSLKRESSRVQAFKGIFISTYSLVV
jgi:hypothetical protein